MQGKKDARVTLIIIGALLLMIVLIVSAVVALFSHRQSPTTDAQAEKVIPYQVKVYYSKHPDSDADPAAVFPVQRAAPNKNTAYYAVESLLTGPTTIEATRKLFSAVKVLSVVSNCQGPDFELNISSGIATLVFCRPFNHQNAISDGQAESEINETLHQFKDVQKVVVINSSGGCEFNVFDHNLCPK